MVDDGTDLAHLGEVIGEWIADGLVITRSTCRISGALPWCNCDLAAYKLAADKKKVAQYGEVKPVIASSTPLVFGSEDAKRIARDNRVLAELVEYLVVEYSGFGNLDYYTMDDDEQDRCEQHRPNDMSVVDFNRVLKVAMAQANKELAVQP